MTEFTTVDGGIPLPKSMLGMPIIANPKVPCNMIVIAGQEKIHIFTLGKDTCLCGEQKVTRGTA